MKPPLRAEDHDEVTAQSVLSRGNDYPSCGRMDVGAFSSKNVDAFMSHRFAPGICPEGVLVIAMSRGSLYWHHEVLGDDPADGQDGCKNKPGFEPGSTEGVVFFHIRKDNIGCPPMQSAND